MIKFSGFTEKDFDAFVFKNKKGLKKVKEKLKNLIEIISKRLSCYSGIYKYPNGDLVGYLSKTRDRKKDYFFTIQVNAEDISLQFQIENKKLLFNFIKNIALKIINDFKKEKSEIVIWDKNKKVLKFYPGYIDKNVINFLMDKSKSIKYPTFKFRKIYPRDEKILKSPSLINELMKSIKKMKVFNNFEN